MDKWKNIYWEYKLNHLAVIEKYKLNKAYESRRIICRIRMKQVDGEWKLVHHPPYAPDWFSPAHVELCWREFDKWYKIRQNDTDKSSEINRK